MKTYNKGFDAALGELKRNEIKEAQEAIKNILGVKSDGAFSLYRRGKIIPAADKAEQIEAYFNSKGIYNVYK